MRPTQEWKHAGACPVSRRGKHRMHFSDLPVDQLKKVFLYGQAGHAGAPSAAALLVDQHDAVFAAFVDARPTGTPRHTPGSGSDCRCAGSRRTPAARWRRVARAAPASGSQVRIVLRVNRRAAEVVIPVRPGFDVDVLAGDHGDRLGRGLVRTFGSVEQVLVVVGPRLVVVVHGGLVGIVEDVEQGLALVLRT